eukprot:5026099-Lingulodinium_polyedra.AAC.1
MVISSPAAKSRRGRSVRRKLLHSAHLSHRHSQLACSGSMARGGGHHPTCPISAGQRACLSSEVWTNTDWKCGRRRAA